VTVTTRTWSKRDQKAIRAQLDRIIASSAFAQSRRRQRFLEYLVGETLAGRGKRLKGYNIAIEVFGRPLSFNPALDPLVRVEAARLRDKLREYYAADGRNDPIRIELPKGVYAPLIDFRRPGSEVPEHKGPAIAVLPFINLSGDPNQDYFSDGLTEDILTELSRARDLRVLTRNTTFQYKGRAVDIPKLGRELGLRYVLVGSVQRTGERLRITAQLIDAETGAHVWADRFDREMANVFLVRDEVVSAIFARIAGGYGVIESTEARSATRKSSHEIKSYDLILQARAALMEYNLGTFRAAKRMLAEAISLDPTNVKARREAAWLALVGWVFRYDEFPLPAHEITGQAVKAVQLDPEDARARMVAACAFFFARQLDMFEREAAQAMALAPNDAEILAILSYMISSAGQWQRGVALAERAMTLNADVAKGWYLASLFKNDYLKGNYARALKLIRQDPDQRAFFTYIDYISIYGQLGRTREALENWRKLLAEDPSWSAEAIESWHRFWNMRDEDVANLMEGVYKSGVLGAEAEAAPMRADAPGALREIS